MPSASRALVDGNMLQQLHFTVIITKEAATTGEEVVDKKNFYKLLKCFNPKGISLSK